MFGGRKPVYTPGTGQNLAFLTSGMYSKGPSFAVEDAVTLNDRPQQQIAKDCRSHHMPAWANSRPCTKSRELFNVDSLSQKCVLPCTQNGQYMVRNGRSILRPQLKLTANLFGRFAWTGFGHLSLPRRSLQALGPHSGQDPFPDSLYLPYILKNFPCGPGLKLENVPERSLWIPSGENLSGRPNSNIWRTRGSGGGFWGGHHAKNRPPQHPIPMVNAYPPVIIL